MKKYKVYLHSKAGFWEHYSGYVPVTAENAESAIDRALTILRRKSFPDRGRDAWVVDRVELTS